MNLSSASESHSSNSNIQWNVSASTSSLPSNDSGENNTTVECEITPSGVRGKPHLWSVNEKQLYKKNRKNAAGHMGYTCIHNGCTARIYEQTVGSLKRYYFGANHKGHEHDTAEQQKMANALKEKVKVRCENLDYGENGSSVADIYNEVKAK